MRLVTITGRNNPGDADHYFDGLENGKSYILKALTFSIATDATVANRTINLQVSRDGFLVAAYINNDVPITASLNLIVSMLPGLSLIPLQVSNRQFVPLPEITIPQNGQLNLFIDGGVPGDALLNIRAMVLEV